jgi:HK97 family phage major capsid protein
MSDAQEALELLKKQQADNEQLKKSVEELSKADNAGEIARLKEKQAKIDEAMIKNDETIDKLVKSIEAEKLKTKQYNEFDKSAQKRAEYMEFLSKLRDVADGNLKQFNTMEMKSVQDLMEKKDYNSLDDSQGGVAVIPTLDSNIDKLIREFSMVRTMAETITVSTDKYEQLKMNQDNGATWEKDLSNFTTQTKDNTLSKLSIAVENLYSFSIFHKNLIADNAFNLVNAILTNSAEDFAIAEGTSFWTGNGVGEMYGILSTSDASDSFDKIERVETAAANTITFEDIYDLIGALKQPYEPNAQFKAHRLTIQVLRKLRSDGGGGAGTGDFLWQPSNIVGVPATLAGFPISQATELSSLPLVNNTEAIVFGDFRKGYKIIDRMGLEVMRDDVTQYPYVKYNSHKRVSGGTNKGEALKILKTKSA